MGTKRPLPPPVSTAAVTATLAAAAAMLAWLPWLWWHGGIAELKIRPDQIRPAGGVAYEVRIWSLIQHSFAGWVPVRGGDPVSFFFRQPTDSADAAGSTLELYENGVALGPAHSRYGDVHRLGGGRYSDRDLRLLFSTSDDSDPRSNGRVYILRGFRQPRLEPIPVATAAILWLLGASLLLTAVRRRQRIAALLCESFTPRSLYAVLLAAAFTFYAFFFPSLRRNFDFLVLVAFAVAGSLLLVISRRRPILRGWMVWPAAFLVHAAIGILWNATSLASWTAGRNLAFAAVTGVVVFSVMRHGSEGEKDFVGGALTLLCLSVSAAVFLQNVGFELKEAVARLDGSGLLPWNKSVWTWNQKYQESWVLVLTWCAVWALAPRGRGRWGLTGLLLAASALATFTGYSSTAKLAWVAGGAVFSGAFFFPRTARSAVAGTTVLLLLLAPVMAGVAWSWALGHPSLFETGGAAALHGGKRLVVWEYARSHIAERPWLGWGLGSADNLPGKRLVAGEHMATGTELPAVFSESFLLPGGHPHSLALLIWLETGGLGAALAAGFLLALFRRLAGLREPARHAAGVALACTCLVVFGLNYPAWEPAVLMLMLMTGGLAALAGGGGPHRGSPDESEIR